MYSLTKNKLLMIFDNITAIFKSNNISIYYYRGRDKRERTVHFMTLIHRSRTHTHSRTHTQKLVATVHTNESSYIKHFSFQ